MLSYELKQISFKVAFHIFTNGTKTLGLNLTQRFKITDEGELVTETESEYNNDSEETNRKLQKN